MIPEAAHPQVGKWAPCLPPEREHVWMEETRPGSWVVQRQKGQAGDRAERRRAVSVKTGTALGQSSPDLTDPQSGCSEPQQGPAAKNQITGMNHSMPPVLRSLKDI